MKARANRRRAAAAKESASTKSAWFLALLAVLCVIAYWNSFKVPLVFDDLVSIQKNTGVQFGDFLKPALFATRPVLYITFAVNYQLHGEQVWGYHLVSVVLHLLNTFLVFFIALHIFSLLNPNKAVAAWSAFFAAACFLLHPVQTESVTYISSRSELLSTFFYAGAVLLFLKRDPQRIGFLWSLLVAVPFFLGLLSKETVLTLPAVLFVYDYLFLSELKFRSVLARWKFYAIFVAGGIVAAYFLVTVVLVGSIGPGLEGHLSSWHYLLTQTRVLVTYIRLLFLPVALNLDYDFRPSLSPFEPAVLGSVLVLSALLALAWYLRKRQPVFSFSIFWFFITLAPTSSFVPIIDTIFEHRLYLPMVGICLSFPLLVGYLISRSGISLPVRYASLALLAVLLVGTVFRNDVWGNEIGLWSDIISKSPHKARGYNGLALAHFKLGDYANGAKALEEGRDKISGTLERRSFTETLGSFYLKTGEYDKALKAFQETTHVDDDPKLGIAYNNIGVTYQYMTRSLEQRRSQIPAQQFSEERDRLLTLAQEAFDKSFSKNSSNLWSLDSYINVTSDRGKAKELAEELRLSLQTKESFKAYYGLGKIAFNANDFATAVEYFEKARKLNDTHKVLFFNTGYAFERLGRADDAIQAYIRALRIEPLFGEAHHNLALLYMNKSDYQSALKHFTDSLRLDPKNISTNLNMAKIYIQLRDRERARERLSVVLNVSPQNQDAMKLWQQTGS